MRWKAEDLDHGVYLDAWGVFQALAHNRHALEKKRVLRGVS